MGLFNPRNVVDLLIRDYEHLNSTPIQEDEIRMKDTIKEILDNYVQDPNSWCEEEAAFHVDEDTLSRTRSGLGTGDPENDRENVAEEEYEEEKDADGNAITLSYKTKAVDHWRSCKRKPRRDLRSVQHTYKKVKSISQLERWEKTVLNSGTVKEKHAKIDRKVKERFDEAKGGGKPIHDLDIQKWAVEAPNLKIVASKSGKCTSAILKDWYINVFCAQIKAEYIILLDAFGGFNAATDSRIASAANEGTNSEEESAADNEDSKIEIVSEERPPKIKVHRIPKNTTGLIQPLDRFGFRLYKNLLRTTSDRVVLQKHDFGSAE